MSDNLISDGAFLDYCENLPHAGLLPEHLSRLYRLAGDIIVADMLAMVAASIAQQKHNPMHLSGLIIEPNEELQREIRVIVRRARNRLSRLAG
jgi:hypothetical protein